MVLDIAFVQVSRDEILRYAGKGKPPRIVMKFSQVFDKTAPLQITANFGEGVIEPKKIRIDMAEELLYNSIP